MEVLQIWTRVPYGAEPLKEEVLPQRNAPGIDLHLLPLYHRLNLSRLNNETYTGDFSDPLANLPAHGLLLLLPNMAAELQASSQPLLSARPATAATLCLTNHTVSTMQRLNLASTGVTSKLLTRHPHIIRPRQQFLRSESGSYLSLRKMLITFWRTVLAEGINSVFERPNLFVSAISQPHSSRCQCDTALISLPVWSWPCC